MLKRTLYALALGSVVMCGTVAHGAAQTAFKPRYYKLDIGIDGKAYCFNDGSDCKVGS